MCQSTKKSNRYDKNITTLTSIFARPSSATRGFMALLSSSVGGEVGLRLLLSPVGTNIIARTACVTVGLGFPVYSTFKAIERKSPLEQEQWLVYWAVYGCFSVVEIFSDKLLSWFPLYYHVKLGFLFWLQLPHSQGARRVFARYLRPLLMRHQARLDRIVDGTRNDINSFLVSHQKEIQLAKALCHRAAITVYQAAVDIFRSSGSSSCNLATTRTDSTSSNEASDENPRIDDRGWIDIRDDNVSDS